MTQQRVLRAADAITKFAADRFPDCGFCIVAYCDDGTTEGGIYVGIQHTCERVVATKLCEIAAKMTAGNPLTDVDGVTDLGL